MCYNPTDYNHCIARVPNNPPPPPPPTPDLARNPGLCLFILRARSQLRWARSRAGILGARLARFRAPWPLCSNAEPQELRHGGGSSAGLALLPSSFLELRGHSRRTHFLPEVNMKPGADQRGRAVCARDAFSLFLVSRLLFSPSPRFLPPTAKKPRAAPGYIP